MQKYPNRGSGHDPQCCKLLGKIKGLNRLKGSMALESKRSLMQKATALHVTFAFFTFKCENAPCAVWQREELRVHRIVEHSAAKMGQIVNFKEFPQIYSSLGQCYHKRW